MSASSQVVPSTLAVPDIAPDIGTLNAALAFAAAGWYVVPIERGTKNPGSLLGTGWEHLSSLDQQDIIAWWSGTDHGVALHMGRSGAVAIDVDRPENVTDEMWAALQHAPFQSSRVNQPRRGHYLFRQPAGDPIGNSTGSLKGKDGQGWGEVRGLNGVIVVAPSIHPDAETGGAYSWVRTGVLPALPVHLDARLPRASASQAVATSQAVRTFMAEHTGNRHPDLLGQFGRAFTHDVERGESRHQSMLSKAAGAMKEARLGCYPARCADTLLRQLFVDATTRPGTGSPPGRTRTRAEANREFDGILAWAVGQAVAADPADIQTRVNQQTMDGLISSPTTASTPATVSTVSNGVTAPAAPALVSLRDRSAGSPATDTDPVPDAARSALVLTDWHALFSANADDDEWILYPLIPARRSVAIYSAPKVGKSLLLLEIAAHLAAGTMVLGVKPDRPYRVLYVDFENDPLGDVRPRLTDMGFGPDQLGNLCHVSFPSLAPLDTEAGAAELLAAVTEHRCEVVVIDTVSRAVAGEENANDTWLTFYRLTGLRLKAAGVACIRLDHTGKDVEKGMRGGSAKYSDVDAVWFLSAAGKGKDGADTFRLMCTDHRLPIAEQKLMLTRETEPVLRHVVEPSGERIVFDAGVKSAVHEMDELGLPNDTGRNIAVKALAAAGFQFRQRQVREAIAQRKARQVVLDD